MTELEVWKPIECADPYYFISNYGRVRSIARGDKILKHVKTWAGYLRVGLIVNGKQKIFSVHRLVAEAFVPNPYNKPTVNHINEIRDDNRVVNLEWATVKENCNHGRHNKKISESRRGMKFTKEHCQNMSKGKKGKNLNKGLASKIQQFTLEGELVRTYLSISEAHRMTGFSKSHIGACCRGYEKSLRGFLFRYAS